MPRLKKIDDAGATDEVRPVFDEVRKARGNVPNMFRTMAHRPEILRTMAAHFRAVMAPSTLSARLKELVVLRVSEMNGCEYCLASHVKLAAKAGSPPEEIAAVRKGDYSKLPEKDAAAVRWGEWVTLDSNHVPEDVFAAVKKHYTEGEIVEITAAAGLFNYFNRFNNALHMEITT